jgi:hypothetical protein
MKLIGDYHVRLDDGTCWSLDGEDDKSLNWVLRYGSDEDVLKHRLTIASILSSYEALIWSPQKRRNEIIAKLREAAEKRSTDRG